MLRAISNAHERVIRDVCWSPDGRRLLSAAADRTAKVWDVATGVCQLTIPHPETVHSVELSPNGDRLVTACRDGIARLWNATNGAGLGEPMRHLDSLNSARFSPDGRVVVTASDDQTARLWNGETGQALSEPLRLSQAIDDASFSRDGRHVIVRLENGGRFGFKRTAGLRLPPATSELLQAHGRSAVSADVAKLTSLHLEDAFGRVGEISLMAVSPDGVLVAAATGKTVRLWNAQSRQPVATPLVHDAIVNCVRFSRDNRRVATSTAGRLVRVWDARTGHPLSDWISSAGPVSRVGFSADNRWLLTAAGWRWELHVADGVAPRWLGALAEAVAGVRVNAQQAAEPVSSADFARLRDELLRDSGADPLLTWAREFVADEGVVPEH
jgi:WD40 repeat protein